jgi:N-acetylglucosamine-6-phosphate deacetylase
MSTVGGTAASFTLGDTVVRLADGMLTGPDGTLGGAHLDMATAVRRAVELAGLPLADVLRMASATPADCLGLTDRGRLRPGRRADFVVLDAGLGVQETWMAGAPAA